MKTSTVAQGPLGLGGEAITIGSTIYNMESADDYTNATGALRTYLDARALAIASEAEAQRQANADRARWQAKSAGQPIVSVLQMRLAAFAAGGGRLAALDAAIAALPESEFKVRWQEGDRFTRAELDFLVPGTLTLAQANNLFTAAQGK